MLAARRAKAAAIRFVDKAMQANDAPKKVTMDRSGVWDWHSSPPKSRSSVVN